MASLRLLNALNSEDRGLKVRFSLATIAFDRESAQMSQMLSSQGKNAPSNPYPHYLVRLAASRFWGVIAFLQHAEPTLKNPRFQRNIRSPAAKKGLGYNSEKNKGGGGKLRGRENIP